jgi:hypothetical protein
VPAVFKGIVAAAAKGLDTELGLAERRWGDASTSSESLRAQFAEENGQIVAILEDWVGIIMKVGPSAALAEKMAMELTSLVSKFALPGLKRPVGFCCNDPLCRNLQGLSKVGLVMPRVMKLEERRGEGAGVCGRCKAACYCSELCQCCHRDEHCAICKPALVE